MIEGLGFGCRVGFRITSFVSGHKCMSTSFTFLWCRADLMLYVTLLAQLEVKTWCCRCVCWMIEGLGCRVSGWVWNHFVSVWPPVHVHLLRFPVVRQLM